VQLPVLYTLLAGQRFARACPTSPQHGYRCMVSTSDRSVRAQYGPPAGDRVAAQVGGSRTRPGGTR